MWPKKLLSNGQLPTSKRKRKRKKMETNVVLGVVMYDYEVNKFHEKGIYNENRVCISWFKYIFDGLDFNLNNCLKLVRYCIYKLQNWLQLHI